MSRDKNFISRDGKSKTFTRLQRELQREVIKLRQFIERNPCYINANTTLEQSNANTKEITLKLNIIKENYRHELIGAELNNLILWSCKLFCNPAIDWIHDEFGGEVFYEVFNTPSKINTLKMAIIDEHDFCKNNKTFAIRRIEEFIVEAKKIQAIRGYVKNWRYIEDFVEENAADVKKYRYYDNVTPLFLITNLLSYTRVKIPENGGEDIFDPVLAMLPLDKQIFARNLVAKMQKYYRISSEKNNIETEVFIKLRYKDLYNDQLSQDNNFTKLIKHACSCFSIPAITFLKKMYGKEVFHTAYPTAQHIAELVGQEIDENNTNENKQAAIALVKETIWQHKALKTFKEKWQKIANLIEANADYIKQYEYYDETLPLRCMKILINIIQDGNMEEIEGSLRTMDYVDPVLAVLPVEQQTKLKKMLVEMHKYHNYFPENDVEVEKFLNSKNVDLDDRIKKIVIEKGVTFEDLKRKVDEMIDIILNQPAYDVEKLKAAENKLKVLQERWKNKLKILKPQKLSDSDDLKNEIKALDKAIGRTLFAENRLQVLQYIANAIDEDPQNPSGFIDVINPTPFTAAFARYAEVSVPIKLVLNTPY